jgi:hypothetical protein
MLAMATPPTSPMITAIARYPAQSCRIPARSRYQADRAADGITGLPGFASTAPGPSHQRPQVAAAIPVQRHAPAADPLRHRVVISRIRHTSQDAATKLNGDASYTSRTKTGLDIPSATRPAGRRFPSFAAERERGGMPAWMRN